MPRICTLVRFIYHVAICSSNILLCSNLSILLLCITNSHNITYMYISILRNTYSQIGTWFLNSFLGRYLKIFVQPKWYGLLFISILLLHIEMHCTVALHCCTVNCQSLLLVQLFLAVDDHSIFSSFFFTATFYRSRYITNKLMRVC